MDCHSYGTRFFWSSSNESAYGQMRAPSGATQISRTTNDDELRHDVELVDVLNRSDGVDTRLIGSAFGKECSPTQPPRARVREARRAYRRRCRWRAGATFQWALEHPAGAASLPAPAAPQQPAARRRYETTSARPHWHTASLRPYLRSSTAPRRACGLHSGQVHGRHQVPHLLEHAFPSQPRHTVAQQSSTSPGVRVAAAPEPIGPGWAVASQLGSLALARPRWLFTSSIRFSTPCIPSSPAKAAGGRSRAANSNNSPPPCVPVADSRAQLAMGGQERCKSASGAPGANLSLEDCPSWQSLGLPGLRC